MEWTLRFEILIFFSHYSAWFPNVTLDAKTNLNVKANSEFSSVFSSQFSKLSEKS